MSSQTNPTPIPDPMGRNLPANERVIRGDKWEPDFDPLGQPDPVQDSPMPDDDVVYTATSPDDQAIPDAPYYGNPPKSSYRRSTPHRDYHRHNRKHHGKGFGWIWILFAFAAWNAFFREGGSNMGMGMHFSWWWLLLCWPLWGLMRGLFGSNRGALATLLIVAGVVLFAQTIGFTGGLILPVALLVIGGLLFMRSIGLFSAT